MLSVWLSFALMGVAIEPPTESPFSNAFVLTTNTVEHVAVPRGAPRFRVELDPLSMQLTLVKTRGSKRDWATLEKRLRKELHPDGVCRTIRRVKNKLILGCQTRQLDARLIRAGGKRVLELVVRRGLPESAYAKHNPHFSYPPTVLKILDSCPGKRAVTKGECAYAEGHQAEAATYFLDAYDGVFRAMAALRLGDIAAAGGDLGKAARWYGLVPPNHKLASVAAARLCELTGACVQQGTDAVTFSAKKLPSPFGAEMVLRRARLLAFMDRPQEAVAVLTKARRSIREMACGQNFGLCRRLALAAIEDASMDEAPKALEFYLTLGDVREGPYARRLALAAAQKASDIGAPHFAATLLTSVTHLISKRALPRHLQTVVRQYAKAEDKARAEVVLAYAQAKLGRRAMRAKSWKAIRRTVDALPEHIPVVADADAPIVVLPDVKSGAMHDAVADAAAVSKSVEVFIRDHAPPVPDPPPKKKTAGEKTTAQTETAQTETAPAAAEQSSPGATEKPGPPAS